MARLCDQKVCPALVLNLHVLQEQSELCGQSRLSRPGEGKQSSRGFMHDLKQRSSD